MQVPKGFASVDWRDVVVEIQSHGRPLVPRRRIVPCYHSPPAGVEPPSATRGAQSDAIPLPVHKRAAQTNYPGTREQRPAYSPFPGFRQLQAAVLSRPRTGGALCAAVARVANMNDERSKLRTLASAKYYGGFRYVCFHLNVF